MPASFPIRPTGPSLKNHLSLIDQRFPGGAIKFQEISSISQISRSCRHPVKDEAVKVGSLVLTTPYQPTWEGSILRTRCTSLSKTQLEISHELQHNCIVKWRKYDWSQTQSINIEIQHTHTRTPAEGRLTKQTSHVADEIKVRRRLQSANYYMKTSDHVTLKYSLHYYHKPTSSRNKRF